MDKVALLNELEGYDFSKKVLDAFSKVKREDFVPDHLKHEAYENIPLPLEENATISQPYTIAFMLDLLELKRGQKVLEIGSGCGYVLALIFEITKGSVYGVEISESLVKKSKNFFKKYSKIKIYLGDGNFGLSRKQMAPYDRILASANFKKLPTHLYSQLKDGGIMVAPVLHSIFKIEKNGEHYKVTEYPGFSFVPMQKEKH